MRARLLEVLVFSIGLAAAAPDASAYYTFGYPGADGFNGQRGRDGFDGQNVTIEADGSAKNFALSGTDGEQGWHGQPGQRATHCYQPTALRNEYGARGGDGGHGGDGGRGGDAGDITVHYDDEAALKQIHVQALPGRGAPGGYGSVGGEGCHCRVYRWSIRQCAGPNNTNCSDRHFSCASGAPGSSSRNGSSGRDGYAGSVTLIPLKGPLPPADARAEGSIDSLASGARFWLSAHLWSTRTGARDLFAPGSQISDSYRRFDGLAEKEVTLQWAASRPASDFGDEKFQLSLRNGTEVQFELNPTLWSQVERSESATSVALVIRNLIRESEARQLRVARFTGYGANAAIELADPAHLSDALTTQVHLTLKRKKILFYKKLFSGQVPADLVEVSRDGIRIQIGKLVTSDVDTQLRAGRKVKVELKITRSLGGNSTRFTLKSKQKLVTH